MPTGWVGTIESHEREVLEKAEDAVIRQDAAGVGVAQSLLTDRSAKVQELIRKLEATELTDKERALGEEFVRQGKLIANEMAPRVHNSGHWTIEGADTSQFENHVRAIAGLPLGSTRARGHSAMINLIGEMPSREALLAEPGLHWHDYGKSPRPGRKLGHITLVEDTARRRDTRSFKVLGRTDRATWLAIR
jgi:phosphoribosylaminoimidazole carboxylase (NCAIR synthetase)